MIIIGITGTLGAGKGTVVEYLVSRYGFKNFAVSDTFLAGEAVKRGIQPTRIARRDIANEYRALGPTKLMEAVYEMAKSSIDAGENVIIEPQHTAAEVKFIQSIGGIELSIDANLKTRYERIVKRGSDKDKVGYEEFEKEQIREMASEDPNLNNLGAAIAVANFLLTNDGTLEDLHKQVDDIMAKISKNG